MREGHPRAPGAPEVRTLSEREIQDRLYGGYLGARRGRAEADGVAPTRTVGTRPGEPESPWTGSGILTGELDRLRSELIVLREQKEQMATALRQLSRSSGPGRTPEARGAAARTALHGSQCPIPPAGADTARLNNGPSVARWVGRLAAVALLVGAGGYLAGGRLLQASPAAGDPTPFTVQVAVYDTRVPAQLAVQFLEGMSYGAFLVEVPRKDGKVRYRICMGTYVTKDEAEMERLRLLGDPRFSYFKDAFVRVR